MITYEDKVALNENSDIADINKVTAGDMNQIKQVVNSLANLFFPIKKIVIFNDNDDHSNYLGFTWERIADGKMLISIDSTDTDFNTIGKTGGEKTHIHEAGTLGACIDPSNSYNNLTFARKTLDKSYILTGYIGDFSSETGGGSSNQGVLVDGNTDSASNMPPYYVAAYWQRIS